MSHVSTIEAANELGITAVAGASLLQGKVARGLPQNVRETLGNLPNDALTAIQFVRSTLGFATALIDMSRAAHVEENLKLAQVEPISTEDYQRLFTQHA